MPSILPVLTSRNVNGTPVDVAPTLSVSALAADINKPAVMQSAAVANLRKEFARIMAIPPVMALGAKHLVPSLAMYTARAADQCKLARGSWSIQPTGESIIEICESL